MIDDAKENTLAYTTFPKERLVKSHSTNPIKRLNGKIKRRTDVAGVFPNEKPFTRLIGDVLLEQNDERAVRRARYMTLKSIGSLGDDKVLLPPAVAV